MNANALEPMVKQTKTTKIHKKCNFNIKQMQK
jgi:hypothetical protein